MKIEKKCIGLTFFKHFPREASSFEKVGKCINFNLATPIKKTSRIELWQSHSFIDSPSASILQEGNGYSENKTTVLLHEVNKWCWVSRNVYQTFFAKL